MKKRMRWLVVVTIMAFIGVGIYYYQSNNPDESDDSLEEPTITEVDKVLNKDLVEHYPYTAREVVQFFTRIQKCYYNEEYTDEELVKLAYKAMALFDEELTEENPFDEYYEDLKIELDAYKATNQIINRVIIEDKVTYSTVEEQKYASINCLYYLKSDAGTSKVEETYILRKDADERWKILGWKEYEESEWE